MTEDELVEAIRARLAGSERRIDMRSVPEPPQYGVAGEDAVIAAEAALGVPLPRLLKRLYLTVENGGFGPGAGVFGVERGHPGRDGMTLGELYRYFRTSRWPKGSIPLCDWGGGAWSAIDATGSEPKIVTIDESGVTTTEHSLKGWLEAWIKGADMFRETFTVEDIPGTGLPHPVTKKRIPFQRRTAKGTLVGWQP